MKYKFEDIIYNITEKKKPSEEDRLNYIGLEHLDSGSLFVTRWGAERTPEGEKIVMKKGDVLFGKRRAYQKKVAISPIDGVFSAHGMVLRPKENVICKEFLPFFISSDYFLNEAIRISVGGLSPTINWKDIKVLEFNLPSLEEQKVLAEKLWAAYEVKQSYLKMIETTQEMVKSQFVEMFGSIKDNRHHYEICHMSDVCKILNGYAFQSKKYVSDGIRVIRIANVQKGFIEDTDPQFYPQELKDEIKDFILKENDILLSLTGNVGRVGMLPKSFLPAALNQRVACVRPNDRIDNYFLYCLMNQDFFEKDCVSNSSGSAQKNMSTEWLKNYQFVLPGKEEQKTYVDFSMQADNTISELRKSIDAIDKVIKSLINENL